VIRKKLPAFGAALRDRRRRGEHPLCVHLIYGHKWRAAPKCAWGSVIRGVHPELALKPEDFAAELFDFSAVMGLQVCVFDQMGEAAWYEDPCFGPVRPHFTRFYHLLGELASVAADIEIYSPAFGRERWRACELAAMGRRRQLAGDAEMNHGWPSWWSAETEQNNAKRRDRWCRIVFAPAADETASA
jgi:hypothetical protein